MRSLLTNGEVSALQTAVRLTMTLTVMNLQNDLSDETLLQMVKYLRCKLLLATTTLTFQTCRMSSMQLKQVQR